MHAGCPTLRPPGETGGGDKYLLQTWFHAHPLGAANPRAFDPDAGEPPEDAGADEGGMPAQVRKTPCRQKSGQFQPFVAFPQEFTGQLASSGPT
jgi:hypothetical protein